MPLLIPHASRRPAPLALPMQARRCHICSPLLHAIHWRCACVCVPFRLRELCVESQCGLLPQFEISGRRGAHVHSAQPLSAVCEGRSSSRKLLTCPICAPSFVCLRPHELSAKINSGVFPKFQRKRFCHPDCAFSPQNLEVQVQQQMQGSRQGC